MKASFREYYEVHKDKIKASFREYYESKASFKEYCKSHEDKRKASFKEYFEFNEDKRRSIFREYNINIHKEWLKCYLMRIIILTSVRSKLILILTIQKTKKKQHAKCTVVHIRARQLLHTYFSCEEPTECSQF